MYSRNIIGNNLHLTSLNLGHCIWLTTSIGCSSAVFFCLVHFLPYLSLFLPSLPKFLFAFLSLICLLLASVSSHFINSIFTSFYFLHSLLAFLRSSFLPFLHTHNFNTNTCTVWVEGGCKVDAPNNNRKGVFSLAPDLFDNPFMNALPTFRE